MPILQLNIIEGRTIEQKRNAVAALTEAVVRTLGVKPEQVRVMIHEMPGEHFAIAGQTAAMRAEAAREVATDSMPAPGSGV